MEVKYNLLKTCRTCLQECTDLESVFTTTTTTTTTPSMFQNYLDITSKNTNTVDTMFNDDELNQINNSSQTKTLNEIIMECSSIQITKDDGMPDKICINCLQQVKIAFDYRKKCEYSDLKLRRYLKDQYPIFDNIKIENNNNYNNYKNNNNNNNNCEIIDGFIEMKPEIVIDPLIHSIYSVSEHFNLPETYIDDNDFAVTTIIDPNNIEITTVENIDNVQPPPSSPSPQSPPPQDISTINMNFNYDDNFQSKNLRRTPPKKHYNKNNNHLDDDDYDYINVKDNNNITTKAIEMVNNKNEPGMESDTNEENILVDQSEYINGRYICKFCNKSLCDRRTLKLHLRLHTGKNLKRCLICNKDNLGFAKTNHLSRHMSSHTKEKCCNYCPATFITSTEKRIHIETTHKPKKKRKRGCMAAATTVETVALVKNVKYDTFFKLGHANGEKQCTCLICNQTFRKIRELKYHITQIHSETESFKNLNLKSVPQLFNVPNINLFSNDELIDIVKGKIKNNEHYQYYQIVNSYGRELNLNDSETDLSDINDIVNDDHNGNDNGVDRQNNNNNNNNNTIRYQAIKIVVENDVNFEIKIEDERIKYKCELCDKQFDRIYKIVYHMRYEHENEQHLFDFKCRHCNDIFPTELILKKHLMDQCENQHKSIRCSLCEIRFMWQSSLDQHVRQVHASEYKLDVELQEQQQQQQQQRNKKLTGKTEGKSRKRNSTNKIKEPKPKFKTFFCALCPKSFYRQEHLERHHKVHNPAEKRFGCDVCRKKFNRKDNLKSHMRVHLEDKEKEDCDKHLCVYCGRSFSNSSNLIVHMRRHTGEKPYKCDLCDKGFPRSSDLSCHRRTHTGEKPCLCTICGKSFSRSNKLVRHMRIHTGVRPYKCTFCDRAFTQSNDLTLHIRRHTGDKPYVCGVCGDRFIQGTALQNHRRIQGHFEDNNQASPFASISVNNPNRYTNANRVNRIGLLPTAPVVKQERNLPNQSFINSQQLQIDNNPLHLPQQQQQQQQQQHLQQQQHQQLLQHQIHQQLQQQQQHQHQNYHHHLQHQHHQQLHKSVSLIANQLALNHLSDANIENNNMIASSPTSRTPSIPLNVISPMSSSVARPISPPPSSSTTSSSSSLPKTTIAQHPASSFITSAAAVASSALRNNNSNFAALPYLPGTVPFFQNLEVPAIFSLTHNYNQHFN